MFSHAVGLGTTRGHSVLGANLGYWPKESALGVKGIVELASQDSWKREWECQWKELLEAASDCELPAPN